MPINLNELRMNYVGACGLLCRLSNRPGLTNDDRDAIHRAVQDCADMFSDRLEVVEVGGGGVSLEPKSQE